jgi:hypothetical protein
MPDSSRTLRSPDLTVEAFGGDVYQASLAFRRQTET